MNAKRSRNIFLFAIALSLIVHLLLAGYLRLSLHSTSQEEAPIAQVHLTRIARIAPHTPPPPAPAPTPAALKTAVHPPVLSNKGPGPAVAPHPAIATGAPVTTAPHPTPVPSAIPTPAASAGPCGGHKDADPAVQSTPDVNDIPPEARASKASGIAQIKVSLDPTGRVTATALAQSSGNAGLDAVADRLARGATYTPKYANCKPVAGEFVFTVKFSPL